MKTKALFAAALIATLAACGGGGGGGGSPAPVPAPAPPPPAGSTQQIQVSEITADGTRIIVGHALEVSLRVLHAAMLMERFQGDVQQADALTDRATYPAPTIRGRNATPCQSPLSRPAGLSSGVDYQYEDRAAAGLTAGDQMSTYFRYCGDSGLPVYDEQTRVDWNIGSITGTPLVGGDWRLDPSANFQVGMLSQPAGPSARRVNAPMEMRGYVQREGTVTRVSIEPPGQNAITLYQFQQRRNDGLYDTRGSVISRPSVIIERDAQGVRRMTGSIEFAVEATAGMPLARGLGFFTPTYTRQNTRFAGRIVFDATAPLRVDLSAMANSMRVALPLSDVVHSHSVTRLS
jgi:hypothetical protein